MRDNRQTTPVVLRVWRNEGGVFALFPTLPSDANGCHCDAYARIGQHGGADYRLCIRASRPATAVEGASLIQELERIGYRLRVIQRATAAMHEKRRINLRV